MRLAIMHLRKNLIDAVDVTVPQRSAIVVNGETGTMQLGPCALYHTEHAGNVQGMRHCLATDTPWSFGTHEIRMIESWMPRT